MIDLHHHGDVEVREGLVNLSVNVRTAMPDWLRAALHEAVDASGSYPSADAARAAIAQHHRVDPECVLPTAGGAEAFTLIAQALRPQAPVVVHPQFTEPEVALLAAGCEVRRHLLSHDADFAVDAALLPPDADLIMMGNPTNPTGILHRPTDLLPIAERGTTLVVDEAFLDWLGPREVAASLAYAERCGVLVTRSLTKFWGIPGVRAGYVVGDRRLIARLAAVQPHWSVSTAAAVAMVACMGPQAREAHADVAPEVSLARALHEQLRERGIPCPIPSTPFVLARLGDVIPDPHRALESCGIVVRSCGSFPGLGPEWVRIAVRDRARSDLVLAAIDHLRKDQP